MLIVWSRALTLWVRQLSFLFSLLGEPLIAPSSTQPPSYHRTQQGLFKGPTVITKISN